MPEHIKNLSLGDILTIPIEFVVTSLSTDLGYRKYDTVRLENEDLGLELFLMDTAYEQLVEEARTIMEKTDEKGTNTGLDI